MEPRHGTVTTRDLEPKQLYSALQKVERGPQAAKLLMNTAQQNANQETRSYIVADKTYQHTNAWASWDRAEATYTPIDSELAEVLHQAIKNTLAKAEEKEEGNHKQLANEEEAEKEKRLAPGVRANPAHALAPGSVADELPSPAPVNQADEASSSSSAAHRQDQSRCFPSWRARISNRPTERPSTSSSGIHSQTQSARSTEKKWRRIVKKIGDFSEALSILSFLS
ncbi:hypothetical protein PGT21_016880 [Puccinia graminis f. sp. tritici]|uniref:Uncharacterized protein n=1 Tax=Puccinia graminis f. sp. tritici TaxID=56615 RepID=A0A5B0NXD3_PUCGR|nr:hypothetical protein PGT21_016880 [Puccinia graminis f. sp. tritici]KAA1093316.1 hypothetical protein PGTUg99_019717 [Puccinia graminis f. sp. tritici]